MKIPIEEENGNYGNHIREKRMKIATIAESSVISLLDQFLTAEMKVLQGGKRESKHCHLGISQLFESKNCCGKNSESGGGSDLKNEGEIVKENNFEQMNYLDTEILLMMKLGEWERVDIVSTEEKTIGECKWWEKKDKCLMGRIKELEQMIEDIKDSVEGDKDIILRKNNFHDNMRSESKKKVEKVFQKFGYEMEKINEKNAKKEAETCSRDKEENEENEREERPKSTYIDDKNLLKMAKRGNYKQTGEIKFGKRTNILQPESDSENNINAVKEKDSKNYCYVKIRVRDKEEELGSIKRKKQGKSEKIAEKGTYFQFRFFRDFHYTPMFFCFYLYLFFLINYCY